MNKSRVIWIVSGFAFIGLVVVAAFYGLRQKPIQNPREAMFREIERESTRLHSEFIGVVNAAEAWHHDNDTNHLPEMVRAVRTYRDGQVSREWTQAETAGLVFDFEEVVNQASGLFLVQMDKRFLGLGWTSPDGNRFFVLLDRTQFSKLESQDPRVSLALVNSVEQVLASSVEPLDFEVFRQGLSYGNSPPEVIQSRDYAGESMAWKSVPEMDAVFLVARIKD